MPRRRSIRPRSVPATIAAVVVLVVVGLVAKLGTVREKGGPSGGPVAARVAAGAITPVIVLDVPAGSKEAVWTTALAERLGGRAEARVEFGRVDVLTDTYAIEIDFAKKWHEGIGQALHYGEATGKTPCLALIVEPGDEDDAKEVAYVDKLCLEKGIKFVLLMRGEN